MKRYRIVYSTGGGGGVTFISAASQQAALVQFVADRPNAPVISITEDPPIHGGH